MICTRCEGTGFLNLDQVDDKTLRQYDQTGDVNVILDWISTREKSRGDGCYCAVLGQHAPCGYCENSHDVQVCDCCGDGHHWYAEPGRHYTREDPPGMTGPYAYNGGYCECH